jgi:TfoX/Sxy family transcriptional regulator of competence genes
MKWSKPSKGLLELLEASIEGVDFERKKMFGQYALFLNGNMFAGVFEETVFLRYPPEDQEEVFAEFDEIARFEPMEGRGMREYSTVPDSVFSEDGARQRLLDRSVSYASALPPK